MSCGRNISLVMGRERFGSGGRVGFSLFERGNRFLFCSFFFLVAVVAMLSYYLVGLLVGLFSWFVCL